MAEKRRKRTKLVFAFDVTERDLSEARDRGYLAHVMVRLDDSLLFPVFFYDIVRLGQDLTEMAQHGQPFIADPGMIVLQEITVQTMEDTIEQLADRNYFKYLVPTNMEIIRRASGEWPPPHP